MYYPLSQITTNLTAVSGKFTLINNGEGYIGSYFPHPMENIILVKPLNHCPNKVY